MGDSLTRDGAGVVDANRLLVIFPAWNEESTIGSTLSEVRAAVSEADLLVVDDRSTDRTSEVARLEGATVLSLPYNLGMGGAMRAGYKFARRRGYSRAIQVDADGQHDFKDIEAVLTGLAKADISIGARFSDRGSYTVRGPRKWAMGFLAAVVSRLAGEKLTDVTSALRVADYGTVA